MKPTSKRFQNSVKRSPKSRSAVATGSITEEKRVLDCLKLVGARPMSATTRKRLATSGNLGMPGE